MAPRRRGTSPSVCTSEARPTLRLKEALADRYTLERQLGAGGMATVYLAHDVRHNRKVAIKVMHAELAALIGAERFLKEIETTANLQHPHILPLFDSGQVRRARLRSPPGRDSPRHQAGKRAVPRRPGAGRRLRHRAGLVRRRQDADDEGGREPWRQLGQEQ